MTERYLVETSSYVSYVHVAEHVSHDLLVDPTNTTMTEAQADALVSASEGVKWCGDCKEMDTDD